MLAEEFLHLLILVLGMTSRTVLICRFRCFSFVLFEIVTGIFLIISVVWCLLFRGAIHARSCPRDIGGRRQARNHSPVVHSRHVSQRIGQRFAGRCGDCSLFPCLWKSEVVQEKTMVWTRQDLWFTPPPPLVTPYHCHDAFVAKSLVLKVAVVSEGEDAQCRKPRLWSLFQLNGETGLEDVVRDVAVFK